MRRDDRQPAVELATGVDQVDQVGIAPELMRPRLIGEDDVGYPAVRVRTIVGRLAGDFDDHALGSPVFDDRDGPCAVDRADAEQLEGLGCRQVVALDDALDLPDVVRSRPGPQAGRIDRRHLRRLLVDVPRDLEGTVANHRSIHHRIEVERV